MAVSGEWKHHGGSAWRNHRGCWLQINIPALSTPKLSDSKQPEIRVMNIAPRSSFFLDRFVHREGGSAGHHKSISILGAETDSQ